ncbi:DUF4190 domain-containing protein [Streptomyces sp. DSM 44917]|uniref:DUF4190 domain-containing protein n=1 Tax=Streptomyces boetiae TaxID=3075541 RepID=A0ABU2L9J3_9ACTN|nr:DUF4190 domain-containing protein [Streptomyces sp. DSM 44917]MDT0308172.1 DUF4190 domain-containing protein [Streptomyces sp. DSM 44917]
MTAEQHNPFRPPESGTAAVPAAPPATWGGGYGIHAGYPVPGAVPGPPPGPGGPAPWGGGWGAPPGPAWGTGWGGPWGAAPGPVWGTGWGTPYVPPVNNSTGTAALVLGAVTAALCWTFFLSFLGIITGTLAVILGLLGAQRARRGAATNRGVALGGAWTGAGGLAISLVLTVLAVIYAAAPVEVETAAGAEYLASADEEVRYSDGLSLDIDAPRPAPGRPGVVLLTAVFVNHGDEEADLDEEGFSAYVDGNRLPAGDVRWNTSGNGTLDSDERVSVTWAITVPEGGASLGVDYAPGDGYEAAYWEFTLTGQSGPPAGGAPGGPGEVDA